jgi:drug/metabolite transporter (DMT)-like permease
MGHKRNKRKETVNPGSEPEIAKNSGNNPIIMPMLEIGIYIILQLFSFYIEIGSPFFVLALIYVMFRNTADRGENTKSAYSVFNKNVDRIGGSLTSDQIDGEIRRKMY